MSAIWEKGLDRGQFENYESYTVFQVMGLFYTNWGEGDSTPLQYSCLENPTDGGAW